MSSGASAPPAPGERVGARLLFGWTCLYGIHLFPATVAILPFIGPGRALGAWLERRAPRVALGGRVAHYVLATLCGITLGRIVPFLAPSDWWLAAAAGAAVALATSRRVGASPTWVAPLGLALPLVLLPPMPPSALARLAIGLVAAGAMGAVLLLVGAEARRRASAVAWGYAVLIPSIAFRIVLFWLLPTAEPAAVLSRVPGLEEVVVRPAAAPGPGTRGGVLPISHDDLRLVVEGCDPGSRIVGTLHSLYLRRDGAWSRVGYPPGDRIEVDCARRVAWVPEMVKEKLWSVDLDDLSIEQPFEHCEFAGPTLIRFDVQRRALYGFPNGTHLGRYVPESGECDVAVQGGVMVSYVVDAARQRAIVARNGFVESCPMGGSQVCDHATQLVDPDLPGWLQRGFFNKPFVVVHFNKLALDPVSDSVLATSLHSGRLYRLARDDLALRDEIFLERGIRWVNVDVERRRIFVGGFVRGTLFVLDADSLEVLARVPLGRKIRYLEPMRDGHLLVAVSTGALEIDVDELIRAGGPLPEARALPGLEEVPRISELRRLPDAARWPPLPGGSIAAPDQG